MMIDEYWGAIQQRICPRCIDGNGTGACGLPPGEVCPVKSLLPELISTVAHVRADTYEEYVAALRQNVCVRCNHLQNDLSCAKREDLECALNRYYPLIIDIVNLGRPGGTGS
jgi:hypothetical protein